MENQRLKIKPNFFDLVVLVLLIGAVAAAWGLSHRDQFVRQTHHTYQLSLWGVPEEDAGLVAVGDTVTDLAGELPMGTVTAIGTEPTKGDVPDPETLTVRREAVSGVVTLVLTIDAGTTEEAFGVTTTGGYAIRTGNRVHCLAGDLETDGTITWMER